MKGLFPKNQKTIISVICILISVALFVVIFLRLGEYRKENETIRQTRDLIASFTIVKEDLPEATAHEDAEEASSGTTNRKVPDREDMIDIDALKEQNPDLQCIIRIPGTEIDYPVVQNKEYPEKYLTTDFFGKSSSYGCIFVDASTNLWDNNYITFGHHMRNGMMYGNLKKYADKDYRDAHKEVKLICPGAVEYYEVIGYFTAVPGEDKIESRLLLETREDYDRVTDLAKKNGYLLQDLKPGDRCVTLITCEYSRENSRSIVIAINRERRAFNGL